MSAITLSATVLALQVRPEERAVPHEDRRADEPTQYQRDMGQR